ncbi:MAG TPA: 50S ribosomal protein L19 [Caldisericia bacterium]|jgi:large subunit ribosomal protein L19|nr:50S ribosomal protein L19 [Caldisericia bacterium]HXK51225.1 50S ribosomal protein L19 [Caldisericia bacterium]
MQLLNDLTKEYLKTDVVSFNVGDTVKVYQRIVEGAKERLQVFQGIVIGKKGGGIGESFTVRKISYGEGVEKVFPFHSPSIAKVEVVTYGKVRRAKLYYLRESNSRMNKVKRKKMTKKNKGPIKEAV